MDQVQREAAHDEASLTGVRLPNRGQTQRITPTRKG
jgi:hypothetical protein